MKTRFLVEIFLCCICLSLILSCGQKTAVKEEKPIQEEFINIKTNEVFTTEETVEISNKIRVLILPFQNKSNQTNYPNSKIVNTILLNELYSFLYIVPSFDVPEKTNLADMNSEFLNRKDLTTQDIYSNYQADIVIYGDYSLQGNKSDSKAQIRLNIWEKATGKTETNEYKTPIDADIFDAIDAMLSQIIKSTMNEDLKIAHLNIGNFKIGNGTYSLLINNKIAAKITNDNFSLNLKILPNAIYSVKLRNLSNKSIVLNTPVMLKPGETTNISHTALGSIRCSINNKAIDENFQIFLDGSKIQLDEVLSNLPAEMEYQIKVISKNKSEYIETFYLSDGEFTNLILPKKKIVLLDFTTDNMIHFKLDQSGGSIVTITTYTNNITYGEKCCSLDFIVHYPGSAGIRLNFGYDKMDWSNIKTFKFWIYGTQTYTSYFLDLIDNLNGHYWYWLTDDWKGWKQISILLDTFKFHTPKQRRNKEINKIKVYPLKSIDINMNSLINFSSSGNFRLTIGEMEVTSE